MLIYHHTNQTKKNRYYMLKGNGEYYERKDNKRKQKVKI